MKRFIAILIYCLVHKFGAGQDSMVIYKNQTFELAEVLVRKNFNVPTFIDYVKNDTTFYKAFRNLHILSFSSFNDVKLLNKSGGVQASLISKTRQNYDGNCRTMTVLHEQTTGDFYNKKGEYNYTSAELYASLFFTRGKICGETNIVAGRDFSAKGKSGMEKHKEQLKQLFFNPGTKISGIPFISNKVALFDEDVSKLYDFRIDVKEYLGRSCYVFSIIPKANLSSVQMGNIVIDEMTTWFDASSMDIIARNYSLSFNAGVYDFNVDMEVQLQKVGGLLVPTVLRYKGEWDVIFKRKERAQFTATLFDFSTNR